MDDYNDSRSREGCHGSPGMIEKAAQLEHQEITEAELRAINKLAMEPVTAEQVFIFKAVLCDNEVDRSYERFSLKALQDFKRLFLGKPVIKDHRRSADNQVARIYSTELVQSEKLTKAGEIYTQLVGRCYMVRTASNADLITEIKAGIKREGSVGCSVKSCICSICGTDNAKAYCSHYPGRAYAKEGGDQTCTYTLDGGKDAYEFSLVAVPAQKAAGVSKSYGGETVYEAKANNPETSEKAARLALRARLTAHRINHNTKED